MTDSQVKAATAAEQRPGKRDRLVAAAFQLVHEQGIERTTLADIAELAEVPPGNVYYYFKTKDEVIAAVVQAHSQQIASTLEGIDSRHRSPKGRLKALVAELSGQSEIISEHGCPLGGLCSELDKRFDDSDAAAADLMRQVIDWAEAQFRQIGRSRDARDLALDLLATYEGSALITYTLHDPRILSGAARRLDRWIDAL